AVARCRRASGDRRDRGQPAARAPRTRAPSPRADRPRRAAGGDGAVSDPARLVDVRSDGPVCVIALRREPKLNALSVALESALDAAIAGPEAHAARAVVITGGPRAFSAGAGVTQMRDLAPAALPRHQPPARRRH